MTTLSGRHRAPGGVRRAPRTARWGIAAAVCIAALGLVACNDEPTGSAAARPVAPPTGPAVGSRDVAFLCTVAVVDRRMTCGAPAPEAGAASADVIVGGQDRYVRLASNGVVYDVGAQLMYLDVTIQNLLQTAVGTTDGTTVSGVTVFLVADPTTTQGTGIVVVTNEDGRGTFTGTNQPFFTYAEILEPYQISAFRTWRFSVPTSVVSFQFTAYASLPVVDPSAPLLDVVWTGGVDTDWQTVGNWNGGAPVDTSVVAIPSAALLPSSNMPALAADDTVSSLWVGTGSTLTLNGHVLDVTGNVDALGTIADGPLVSSGASALLGGNLSELRVSGAASLQRSIRSTGPLSITGTLTVADQAMSIAIP